MPNKMEDGVAIDTRVGGISTQELQAIGVERIDVRRVHAVNRLFRLIDMAPAHEPPEHLVDRTLARIGKSGSIADVHATA